MTQRVEEEETLKKNSGNVGMTPEEIRHFVEIFLSGVVAGGCHLSRSAERGRGVLGENGHPSPVC